MSNVRLINLTGHDLTLSDSKGQTAKLQSYGRARVKSNVVEREKIDYEGIQIPLLDLVEQSVIKLPEPELDVIYIVSGLTAAAANRPDVLAPSRVTRDNNGRVTECRALLLPQKKGY